MSSGFLLSWAPLKTVFTSINETGWGETSKKESRYVTLLVSLDVRSLAAASCFGV